MRFLSEWKVPDAGLVAALKAHGEFDMPSVAMEAAILAALQALLDSGRARIGENCITADGTWRSVSGKFKDERYRDFSVAIIRLDNPKENK